MREDKDLPSAGYSSNVCNCGGWTRLKSEVGDSVWIPHMVGRDPQPEPSLLSSTVLYEQEAGAMWDVDVPSGVLTNVPAMVPWT